MSKAVELYMYEKQYDYWLRIYNNDFQRRVHTEEIVQQYLDYYRSQIQRLREEDEK